MRLRDFTTGETAVLLGVRNIKFCASGRFNVEDFPAVTGEHGVQN